MTSIDHQGPAKPPRPDICEGCDNPGPSSYCPECISSFCDQCWEKQVAHRPGKLGYGGKPHEKTDRKLLKKIEAILDPSSNKSELRSLHRNDEDTKWFGIAKSKDGRTQFEDYGRYRELMAETRPLSGAVRFPKLVAFIGDTHAGKSTLVKTLVTQGELDRPEENKTAYPSPVVGSTTTEMDATSEGVHLYADPAFCDGNTPVLYADCEGMNAGEKPPFALHHLIGISDHSRKQRLVKKKLQGFSQEIKWALNDRDKNRREFAVGHLYPRILYTFSDVVVFVQRNPKQFHITCKMLLQWADACVEKSINQPILPHAIIVLNAMDIGNDSERWDIQETTNSFMDGVSDSLSRDPVLTNLAASWTSRKKQIETMKELLECYYSSVQVVRIPAKSPKTYLWINDQVKKLRQAIHTACAQAHYDKRSSRRLADVDLLNEYLRAGFKHFAVNLSEPFDFKHVALKKRPIPQDFGDHVVNLASTIQKSMFNQAGTVLFQGMSSFIVSCILLDIIRNSRPGDITQYFDEYYLPLCKAALHNFCNEHWPCEFQTRRGRRCSNAKTSHQKGHQDDRGKIEAGAYVSEFEADKFEAAWVNILKTQMKIQLEGFESAQRIPQHRNMSKSSYRTDTEIAVDLHKNTTAKFYAHMRYVEHYYNNATCLSCLMSVPEHAIGCGHVFCTACVKDYASDGGDSLVVLRSCPLHQDRDRGWLVHLKPSFAGVRVLCLDGGGIRGIVELEVLKAIETRINRDSAGIPLQRFFDMVVGTSTGGIVALGLVAKQWRIDDCISTFKRVCNQAFTHREFYETWLLEELTTLSHGSKWKTTPLHKVLRDEFGTDLMFGGKHDNSENYATKVAVVATSGSGDQPWLIANFNRQDAKDPSYIFETADDPASSMRIWEAAAATSAAPSFFKPFFCETNERIYLDGALYHNNPVRVAWRERKLVWPDVQQKHPDIFVSLGTGQHRQEIEQGLKKRSKATRYRRNHKSGQPITAYNKKGKRAWRWRGIKGFFGILVNRIDNILDAEGQWLDFLEDNVGEDWATPDSGRYIRLNPDLRQAPPPLDAKDQLDKLQKLVQQQLKTLEMTRKVEDVAHRLIASCFFFNKSSITVHDKGDGYICSGTVRCRFDGHPDEMRGLGRFLQRQLLPSFMPTFVVRIQDGSKEEIPLAINEDMIKGMTDRAEFKFQTVLDVVLPDERTPTVILLRLRTETSSEKVSTKRDYPISGFPRELVKEEETTASIMKLREEALRKRREDGKRQSPLAVTRSHSRSASSDNGKKTGIGLHVLGRSTSVTRTDNNTLTPTGIWTTGAFELQRAKTTNGGGRPFRRSLVHEDNRSGPSWLDETPDDVAELERRRLVLAGLIRDESGEQQAEDSD